MIHLLTVLSLLPVILCNELRPYSIQPLNASAGIFFQHIGNARISPDSYTLLSYTNISLYEQKFNLINYMYTASLPLCQRPKFNNKNNKTDEKNNNLKFTCKESLEIIEHYIDRLNDKFDSICHLTGHNDVKRFRRGLFDGVSYAIKWLFGTPDADDAKFYTEAIEAVAQQNHDMQVLMKQQVHIISEAINDYNKTASTLQFNEQRLNENLMKFNNFSKNTVRRINSLTYSQTVTDHINLLSQLCNELNEEFDIIIASILFSKQNILHPNIITPRHLRYELTKLKLTSNLELPFDLHDFDNSYKYFDLCKLSVIYVNKILIFAIKIPLVTKETYQIFNLIPLPAPTSQPNVYSYINPSIPYLLLSTTRTYYGEFNDLSTCEKSSMMEFICTRAVIHLVNERPTCEIELKMARNRNVPSRCETKTIKSEIEIWHPLAPNQWLYIVSQNTIGTINCESNSQVHDISLQGVGTFTLHPRCKCYTTSTLLTATSNQTGNYSNYIPTIDITKDNCCIMEQDYLATEEMEPIKLSNLNLNELRHAQSKIQQFDDELTQRINQPLYVVKSKWYNILFGIIAAVAIIISFCWCCCRKCRWPLISWLTRMCRGSNCNPLVCINSHNNISHSSLGSDSYINPNLKSIARRPPIPTPRETLMTTTFEDHDYEVPIELDKLSDSVDACAKGVRKNHREKSFKL